MKSRKMQLINVRDKHLQEMMGWFSSEGELAEWSGPNFRYPYSEESFKEDLKLDSLRSFSLISDENEFLAFGQFYNRLEKCHLGRLIVNPKFRGKGIASELMCRLCELGKEELKLKESSLFVLANNESAIKAYRKFGFTFSDYPEKIPIENCLYMIRAKSPNQI